MLQPTIVTWVLVIFGFVTTVPLLIAQFVMLIPPGRAGKVLFRVRLHSARLTAHGHQIVKLIPPVNIHTLGHRTQAMGRVEITIALHSVFAPPQALAASAELEAPQIVQITAFRMDQFPE